MTSYSAAVSLFSNVIQRLPARLQHAWYLIGVGGSRLPIVERAHFAFFAFPPRQAATSAAHGLPFLLPHIYRFAVQDLPQETRSGVAGRLPFDSDTPRRQIVRQLKETLVKSSILIGVGQSIESALALAPSLEQGDEDHTLVRDGLDLRDSEKRGIFGLDRVYKQNIHAIENRFRSSGLTEFVWLSRNVTYGQILGIVRPDFPEAALTFQETEVVVLSCLMARNAHREVLWHLRGCLRSGMSRAEVEQLQQAIEEYLSGLNTIQAEQVEKPMPRVSDVTEEDDKL